MQTSDQNKAKSSQKIPNSGVGDGPGVGAGPEKSQVTLQALRMAFGTMSSRVLGLLRDMALAAFFDRSVTDAWIAAFRLPNLFRRLLGEGSLSASFIPVFMQVRHESPEKTQQFRDGFFTLLCVALTVITAIGILFPDPILRVLLDQNYIDQTAKFAMTVRLTQLMFGFVFFISLYAFFMGILNSMGVFALPAMAPTFFNIALIISTLTPGRWYQQPGDGLALGVLIGGFLQMIVLVPALRRLGQLPSFRWVGFTPEIKSVLKNMAPGLMGLGLLQITTIVNLRFASELGEGAISWIYWADRLLELPLSLVSVSLGTALLPTLSAYWARQQKREFVQTLEDNLRVNFFVCVGAAVGLFVLAAPIVELLFLRRKFSVEDAVATAGVVKIWALIMVPTSAVRLLAPAYYAVKNTWLPAVVSCVCLCVHLLAAPWLMAHYGLTGLNLSSLLSASLNMTLLMIFLPFWVMEFPFLRFLKGLLWYLPGVFALVLLASGHQLIQGSLGDSFVARAFYLAVIVILAGGAYFLAARLLKLAEWDLTWGRVEGKLRRLKK